MLLVFGASVVGLSHSQRSISCIIVSFLTVNNFMVTVRENNDFVVVVGWILIKSPRARSSEVDLYCFVVLGTREAGEGRERYWKEGKT
jgi:hypothetical protein